MNEKRPRWTPEELDLAVAKLHREKVLRVIAINSKIIDMEVEFFPEALPVIEVKGEEDVSKQSGDN